MKKLSALLLTGSLTLAQTAATSPTPEKKITDTGKKRKSLQTSTTGTGTAQPISTRGTGKAYEVYMPGPGTSGAPGKKSSQPTPSPAK